MEGKEIIRGETEANKEDVAEQNRGEISGAERSHKVGKNRAEPDRARHQSLCQRGSDSANIKLERIKGAFHPSRARLLHHGRITRSEKPLLPGYTMTRIFCVASKLCGS